MRWNVERTMIVALAVAIFVGIGLYANEKNGVDALTRSLHRQNVVESRAGCRRGILDRHANAEGWYSAYVARLAQARLGGPDAHIYRRTAETYLGIAKSLNSRTDPANSVVWPLGTRRHPIGVGTLNCDKAFPLT